MERVRSQHPLGAGVGRLALRSIGAGSAIGDMDRLVVSLYSGVTGSDRLAV